MKTYFENMIDNVLFRLPDTVYGVFRLTASEIGEDGECCCGRGEGFQVFHGSAQSLLRRD